MRQAAKQDADRFLAQRKKEEKEKEEADRKVAEFGLEYNAA